MKDYPTGERPSDAVELAQERDFFSDDGGPWDWVILPGEGEEYTTLYAIEHVVNWATAARTATESWLYRRVRVDSFKHGTYTGVVREMYFEFGRQAYALVVAPGQPPRLIPILELTRLDAAMEEADDSNG